MYSKSGKISTEMFPWIQQKEAIINGIKKKNTKQKIKHSQQQSPSSSSSYRSQTKIQPFSKQVGRKEPKQILDRYGFYNPKYYLVMPRSPLNDEPTQFKIETTPKTKSLKHIKQSISQDIQDNNNQQYGEKPLSKPKGYVELIKQEKSPRFPLNNGPNEHRFDNNPYPQSQYQRSPQPIIRPRSCKSKVKKLDIKNGQIYDPNYSFVYPKSAKMVPMLNKLTPRKPFNSDKPIYTLNETLHDENSPRAQSYKFDQQISREKALSHYNSTRRLYYL